MVGVRACHHQGHLLQYWLWSCGLCSSVQVRSFSFHGSNTEGVSASDACFFSVFVLFLCVCFLRCLTVYPWTQRYFSKFGNISTPGAIAANPKVAAHGKVVMGGLELAAKNLDDIKNTIKDLSILHSEKLQVDPDNFKVKLRHLWRIRDWNNAVAVFWCCLVFCCSSWLTVSPSLLPVRWVRPSPLMSTQRLRSSWQWRCPPWGSSTTRAADIPNAPSYKELIKYDELFPRCFCVVIVWFFLAQILEGQKTNLPTWVELAPKGITLILWIHLKLISQAVSIELLMVRCILLQKHSFYSFCSFALVESHSSFSGTKQLLGRNI